MYMKQTELRTPYCAPALRCIDLKLASVVCGPSGVNTPGEDLPWDPGDDEIFG